MWANTTINKERGKKNKKKKCPVHYIKDLLRSRELPSYFYD
jgi:hypothetical protein